MRIRKRVRVRRLGKIVSALVMVMAIPAAASPVAQQSGSARTTRASMGFKGYEGNAQSSGAFISGDGKYVTFTSQATNLVQGDKNKLQDVFVYDIAAGKSRIASAPAPGRLANGSSFDPAISMTGQYVAFASSATNLAGGTDDNGADDIFVWNRKAGTTSRVSLHSNGRQSNGNSFDPSISANGRYVAFTTNATNLAIRGDKNRSTDVFVHDRVTGNTNRVSLNSHVNEANGPSHSATLSGNGRLVAFVSDASNLVPDDTNNQPDIFVYDRVARRTVRVSVSSSGSQADGGNYDPSMSTDGRFIAFGSMATNLDGSDGNGFADIYVHDLETGTTERVSRAFIGETNGNSFFPSISGDGRYVGFDSVASNIVMNDTNGGLTADPNGTDVFVHDRETDRTERVSVNNEGEEANGPSSESEWYPQQGGQDAQAGEEDDPDISDDGRLVCFVSRATNLVPDDSNVAPDVFVRGPLH